MPHLIDNGNINWTQSKASSQCEAKYPGSIRVLRCLWILLNVSDSMNRLKLCEAHQLEKVIDRLEKHECSNSEILVSHYASLRFIAFFQCTIRLQTNFIKCDF